MHKPEILKYYLHIELHTQWEYSYILESDPEGSPYRRSEGKAAFWALSSAGPICTPSNSSTDPESPFLSAEVWHQKNEESQNGSWQPFRLTKHLITQAQTRRQQRDECSQQQHWFSSFEERGSSLQLKITYLFYKKKVMYLQIVVQESVVYGLETMIPLSLYSICNFCKNWSNLFYWSTYQAVTKLNCHTLYTSC